MLNFCYFCINRLDSIYNVINLMWNLHARTNERLGKSTLHLVTFFRTTYSCVADNAPRDVFLCSNNRAAGCEHTGWRGLKRFL